MSSFKTSCFQMWTSYFHGNVDNHFELLAKREPFWFRGILSREKKFQSIWPLQIVSMAIICNSFHYEANSTKRFKPFWWKCLPTQLRIKLKKRIPVHRSTCNISFLYCCASQLWLSFKCQSQCEFSTQEW